MENNKDRQPEDTEEIDLVSIILKIWRNRKFILKVTAVFIVFGIVVALLSPIAYTAQTVMVPQSNEKQMGGGLSSLAAMAGINVGPVGGDILSPKLYPQILNSTPFLKDLMYTSLKFEGYDQPIVILDYYTKEEYKKPDLIGNIKKYTIGLPGLIAGAIKGNKKKDGGLDTTKLQANGIQLLTENEKNCSDILLSMIILTVNEKDGFLNLSVTMPDPYAAAQLTKKTQQLLQKYITNFKLDKVRSNLDFIEGRFIEAKKDFEQVQEARARFKDSNKNIYSALAQAESEKWDYRYNLSFTIYSELAKQLEQAKISVKENSPELTVIEPVTIPNQRSKPRRGMICMIFAVLGICISTGMVIGLPFVANMFDNPRIRKWIVD